MVTHDTWFLDLANKETPYSGAAGMPRDRPLLAGIDCLIEVSSLYPKLATGRRARDARERRLFIVGNRQKIIGSGKYDRPLQPVTKAVNLWPGKGREP